MGAGWRYGGLMVKRGTLFDECTGESRSPVERALGLLR